jgi:hypothetical protein
VPSWPTTPIKSISSFGVDSCAIMSDDRVQCWGRGNAATAPANLFARRVAVGDHYACAILLDGRVRCWGALPWAP